MIEQNTIDQILSIPIVEVIQKRIDLKRQGKTWECCCPFHEEKTPSFKVFTDTNSFKCFGCNEGGNAITFIMKYARLSFPEACKKLAFDHGILMDEEDLTAEQKAKRSAQSDLFEINSLAADYYISQLSSKESSTAKDYALSRWDDKTLKEFNIGYAPEKWDGLIVWARSKGVSLEKLKRAGLITESEKKPGHHFDVFRGRLIIPIPNKSGQIAGFTARSINQKEGPKYLNTRETLVFHKSEILFGLNLAYHTIREQGSAYLVEGNADVIKLHQLGINSAIGSSGTALSKKQILEIKKICSRITLIGDSDSAGVKATQRSAEMIIREGMTCQVVKLPTGSEKSDPDSFFSSHDQFQDYVNQNSRDYIIDLAQTWSKKSKSPHQKLMAISEISSLIVCMEESSHELYVDQISKMISPKKAWMDKIRELREDQPEFEAENERIPKHVNMNDWMKYGFYTDNNCYYFKTKRGIIRGCNFVLKPLFHIKSVINAKRLFRITNEYGVTEVIELSQRDLVSLVRFKECVESLGNFLWEASDNELNKLKRFLYKETATCIEITQLGWQKEKFYAWGNGIFNSSFNPVDEHGIVKHKDKNYYLPAFSSIYSHEAGLFISERSFIHRDENSISLKDYTQKLVSVFGENAYIAICFIVASLFRDIIVSQYNFFPILDLFGPKGTGKTELAVSIMSFFGKQGKGPNINNTSKAALADHVAQASNACKHIDEYKNTIDYEKIEFLKGLWDGIGRTRMNMDKDKKKETTSVDCGVILSGQEMPTADIALFSRLVFLTFNKDEYDDAAKERFNELKQIEKLGNTHITNQLLALRKHFQDGLPESYKKVGDDLGELLKNDHVADRILRNWLVILTPFHALQNHIEFGLTYSELIKITVPQIQSQNRETKQSSEISTFWEMVSYLSADGLIKESVDYKIKNMTELKTDKIDRTFPEPTRVLFIHMARVFHLYRKHGKQAGDKVLPKDSVSYYLKNDKRYLGTSRIRFKVVDPSEGINGDYSSKAQYAYCFLYDELDISLEIETSTEEL